MVDVKKVAHLKSLLKEMEAETNDLISHHRNELEQMAAVVHAISKSGSSININHFAELADIILSRTSFLKKIYIQRLGYCDSKDEGRSMSLAQYADLYMPNSDTSSFKESIRSDDFGYYNSDNKSRKDLLVQSTSLDVSLSPSGGSNINTAQVNHTENGNCINIDSDTIKDESCISKKSQESNKEEIVNEICSSETVYEINGEVQVGDLVQENGGNDVENEYNTKLLSASDSSEIIEKNGKEDKKELNFQHVTGIPSLSLKLGSVVTVEILRMVTPSEFYVYLSTNEEADEFSWVMNDMQKVAESIAKSGRYINKKQAKEKIKSDLCMAYNEEHKFWYRAKITNWLMDYENNEVELYYIDSATKGKDKLANIQPLLESFAKFPSIATRCHLHNIRSIKPNWPDESIKYMKNICVCSCHIVENINGSYGIVLHVDDVNVNEDLIKRGWAKNNFSVTEPLTSPEILALEKLRMEKEDLTSTSNACVAVVGHNPKDEARLCKYYDRNTGDCFKRHNCTKEHAPINPDGWTKDQLPSANFRIPQLVSPKIGANFKLKVTHVNNPTVFTGTYEPIGPSDREFGSLCEFANFMNTAGVVSSLKKLKLEPAIGELVIAPYKMDNCYYRAQILEYIEEELLKVIFVDYGNLGEVALEDLRQFTPDFADFPCQAVQCSIGNISLLPPPHVDMDFPKYRDEVTENMETFILHKTLNCIVIGVKQGEISVIANLGSVDVASYLEELGYAKKKSLEAPGRKTSARYVPG